MKIKAFVTLLVGLLLSAAGWLIPYVRLQQQIEEYGTITLVGVSQTPSSLYMERVFGSEMICFVLFGAALVLCGLFCLLFSKTVSSCCTLKTTALSLALSAVGAMGMICVLLWYVTTAFGEASQHPIAYPSSLIGGVICLAAFALLLVAYVAARKPRFSFKGVAVDVAAAVLFLPPFVMSMLYGMEWLGL